MNAIHIAAIASGGVHFLAYLVYTIALMRGRIEGNPLTWLMFAYGTTFMTVLEYEAQAPWTELVLPTVCAICSVLVSAMTIKPGAFAGVGRPEVIAFAINIILTLIYGLVWLAVHKGWLTPAQLDASLWIFLVTANGGSIASFVPILRTTWDAPEQELAAPWVLWALAYSILAGVTLIETPQSLTLLIYPVVGVVLHALMAGCIIVGRWRIAMTRARA